MKIEVLVDVKTTLGEGPLWDVEEQRLYWVIASTVVYFDALKTDANLEAGMYRRRLDRCVCAKTAAQ
jgi:L-arabinonolactonase